MSGMSHAVAASRRRPIEFDVVGATYLAVAPVGYVYTADQTTKYSTRKYNTLNAALAGLTTNPTTPEVINILGTWIAADYTYADMNTTGNSATNFLLIRTIGAARHNGVWSNTAYRLNGGGSGMRGCGCPAGRFQDRRIREAG